MTAIQEIFHKSQLERIKTECKGVTYASHVKTKLKSEQTGEWFEAYMMKVNLKNELGGKDEVQFLLEVTPDKMRTTDYNFIIETINSGDYGRAV